MILGFSANCVTLGTFASVSSLVSGENDGLSFPRDVEIKYMEMTRPLVDNQSTSFLGRPVLAWINSNFLEAESS